MAYPLKDKVWLTASDVAQYLSISVGTVRNFVYQGKIPYYKPHGRLLFKKADLDVLIEKSKRGGFF